MSSLISSYRKLTDPTDQGVFTNEELLLSLGRIYEISEVNITFGLAAVVDIVIESGDDFTPINEIQVQSTSELVKIEFFSTPVFTGGAPLTFVNQLLLDPRSPLSSGLLNPTISDPGSLGSNFKIRGTAGLGNKEGFSLGTRSSLNMMAPNTKFLLRLTNEGAVGVLDVHIRIGEIPTII